jgi:hypothetical protein
VHRSNKTGSHRRQLPQSLRKDSGITTRTSWTRGTRLLGAGGVAIVVVPAGGAGILLLASASFPLGASVRERQQGGRVKGAHAGLVDRRTDKRWERGGKDKVN